MEVTTRTLLAIIRASRPKFKSREERLAFAVHAFLLAQGYKVVAAGKKADEAAPDEELTGEVAEDGWNELGDGGFAFRYLPESGRKEDALQVKMQAVGDSLLVHWQPVASKEAPRSLELPIRRFATDAPGLEEGYADLDGLLRKLNGAFAPSTAKQATSPGAGKEASGVRASDGDGGGKSPLLVSDGRVRRPDPDSVEAELDAYGDGRLPLELPAELRPESAGGSGAPRGFSPLPEHPGASDLVPPGLRGPGTRGGFGIPAIEPGPTGLDPLRGGMHVGPGDPLYGGRRRPPGGAPGFGPPGARYDPINPAGLPGWNPEDFQRGPPGGGRFGGGPRRPPHPDIQPPGPGGSSADFDSMFG